LISKSPEAITLKAPIISVTEAINGVIDSEKSLAQTTAQMIGARLLTKRKTLIKSFMELVPMAMIGSF
jgi:hypothetical protein